MRIKVNLTGGNPSAVIYHDAASVESTASSTLPPEPPQPVRQRWECEAILCLMPRGDGGESALVFHSGIPYADSYVRARCKLGFDDSGRVWFADQRTQYLAGVLRTHAWGATDIHRAAIVEAADRLAGPEKD